MFSLQSNDHGDIKEKLKPSRRKRIQSLVDLFSMASIDFAVTEEFLALAFSKESYFVNAKGYRKEQGSRYETGDIIRAFYGPKFDQRHIVIDYFSKESDSPAKLQASGFIYHYLPQNKNEELDKKRAQMGVRERIFAALVLVEKAKALGWESVNFADTTDPVERYILKLACENGNLNHTETVEIEENFKLFFEQIDKIFQNVNDLKTGDILVPVDQEYLKNKNASDETQQTAVPDAGVKPEAHP